MIIRFKFLLKFRKPKGACDKLATKNYINYMKQEKENGIQNT
jgi:hypothetical protein